MRITLDPDEVNQDKVVTLTDGHVVELESADRALLDQIARQLYVHRSSYAHSYHDPAMQEGSAADPDMVRTLAPLYRRVTALQEAARKGRTRRPADQLDLALLLQDQVWTSSSGSTLQLAEMTPTHRKNLKGWLERISDELQARARDEFSDDQRSMLVEAAPWILGTPLVRRLAALIEAETARERAMDQARQVARSVEFERSGNWPSR